jgi:2-polyprenyl-3-methyl-5-hydroxy-6-metoxy-1,4-benzoquinol methylase
LIEKWGDRNMRTSVLESSRIVRAVSSRWQRWQKSGYYKRLSVREAFSDIYRTRAWGTNEDRPFCSGDGSIREQAVGPYCTMIRDFIAANNIRRVVDLGCGDFAVGSRFVGPAVHYLGIDVVPDLIHYNQQHFGAPGVEFQCINIIDNMLPQGDLCLVRQVFQHLSNAQILKTLKSLRRYRYVIVTEHVYAGTGLRRNRDKPQGPGTRVPRRSGVFLESPPFNCLAKVVLEVRLAENQVLRSVVL